MKHLVFLLLLSFSVMMPMTLSAQQFILGSVRDGFLKTPLVDAHVTLLTEDSVIVQDSIKVELNQREGKRWGSADFSIRLPKKTCTYLLHATLAGYEDAWKTFSVKAEIDDPYGLDSPLELRRISEMKLSEVVVKATRLKMFYRGDTIVYDASAFKLPNGSMLDDLIRQMPGVTMNDDGEIFVNGRKVDELLLGARSFFGGNSKVMLENLPYYTVKNVKVYERESDISRAVGYDVERKQYVMDVNLKDTYQNGYIGNMEVAGGTQDRWLGRTFLIGFTDRLRFTLLGNANNVNEKRHIGESGSWKPENMPLSQLTTKSVAGNIDYQSKKKFITENFMFEFTSSTDEAETVRRRELFLDGSKPYSNFRSSNTSHSNLFFARNHFKLNIPNKVYADLGVQFTYNKYKINSTALSEDFLDSINTRLYNINFGNGHTVNVDVGGHLSPRFNSRLLRPLSIFYGFKHSEDKNETAHSFVTEQFVTPSFQTQYNANDFHQRETNGNIHLMWSCDISKSLRLELQDRQDYTKRYERNRLFHPDTLELPSQVDALMAITDMRNSYVSDYRAYGNVPTLSLKWRKYIPGEYMKLEYIYLAINITNKITSEYLDYTRNNRTQNKNRTVYNFYPSLTFKILPTKKVEEQLQFQLTHEKSAPSILDMLDYTDDSTPQIVKLGNPKLKGKESTTFNVNYTNRESKRRQQYSFNGNFLYLHRQVAQSVVFNPESSLYTYQPKNIHGAYKATAAFDFLRSQFGKRENWTWQTTLDASYNHSVDHVIQSGMKESVLNTVNTFILHSIHNLSYQNKDVSVKAIGDIHWRCSKGNVGDFTTLNATDFSYGLSARYTIPYIQTTLTTDATMYSRRGYGSSALNTDDFVVNASLSKSLWKEKLIAKIEVFDLLHNLSATQYEVNAQGRTETWFRSLPNYMMLHLVYHWNKDPKK